MSPPPFSRILQELSASRQETLPLCEVFDAFGPRVHGSALLVLSLFGAVPLPMPGTSALFGIPTALVAAHLFIFGGGADLPKRVQNAPVSVAMLRAIARYASPVLRRLERFSRPRWRGLARQDRLVGIASFYLAAIVSLPLPFVNELPSILILLLAWGLLQQDGIVVAIGLLGTVLLTLALALVGFAILLALPPAVESGQIFSGS